MDDPFHETDLGSKTLAKVMKNVIGISFFFKVLNFYLTDKNIYLINNKPNREIISIFSILGVIWILLRYSTKRIRFRIKITRIRNTASTYPSGCILCAGGEHADGEVHRGERRQQRGAIQ